MMKTAFITGAISGKDRESVRAKFQAIAHSLKGIRHVIQPTIISEPTAQNNDALRSDIIQLMGCEELHLCSDWKESKDAHILRDLALRIGIHITYH